MPRIVGVCSTEQSTGIKIGGLLRRRKTGFCGASFCLLLSVFYSETPFIADAAI